jgi:hypothetical protein
MKMKKQISMLGLVVSLLIPNLGITAVSADERNEQVTNNPWEDFDSLSKGQRKQMYNRFMTEGIPEAFYEVLPNGAPVPSVDVNVNGNMLMATSAYDEWSTSVNEMINCVVFIGLSLCNTAYADSQTAGDSAKAKFPFSLHNGQGDAYRHCYWSGLMTRHIGSGNALFVGENHEDFNYSTKEEYEMDSYNNKQGRLAGLRSNRDVDVLYICYQWAKDGVLVTLN